MSFLMDLLHVVWPLSAFIASALIYKTSRDLEGRAGSSLKFIGFGTFMLAVYGVVTGLISIGVQVFTYKDNAWSIAHLMLHLSFTIPTAFGVMNLLNYLGGEK